VHPPAALQPASPKAGGAEATRRVAALAAVVMVLVALAAVILHATHAIR
jgi:hypothetical protein